MTAAERFLLYWAAAGLAFALVAARPDAGQLPVLLAPLALLAALGCSRCLAFARWDLLKQGVAPALLAAPALVYVLFVLETTAMNTRLSPGQQVSLAFLFIGGIGLIVLGAVWSRNSAPAYLAICGLLVGSAYALHSATRVGFASGDEFLLGPVATADASGLADALAEAGPGLRGGISIDPALTAPLAWYTRENPFVRIQPATAASAAIVQPVDLAQPPGFTPLVARSEVAREWYPSTIDPGGVLRWLLYRQAWQPVRSTYAQALVRAEPP